MINKTWFVEKQLLELVSIDGEILSVPFLFSDSDGVDSFSLSSMISCCRNRECLWLKWRITCFVIFIFSSYEFWQSCDIFMSGPGIQQPRLLGHIYAEKQFFFYFFEIIQKFCLHFTVVHDRFKNFWFLANGLRNFGELIRPRPSNRFILRLSILPTTYLFIFLLKNEYSLCSDFHSYDKSW